MGTLKMQEKPMTDEIVRHENAGHDNARQADDSDGHDSNEQREWLTNGDEV